MSSVFAPTTGILVSPKCYPAVLNTKAIASLNWAGFIIDTLIQSVNAKGNKNWFKACMPYLMVGFLNSYVFRMYFLECTHAFVVMSLCKLCM
jgi:hypothetical protein